MAARAGKARRRAVRGLLDEEGGDMDGFWHIGRWCEWRWGKGYPKWRRDEVSRKCREGTMPAVKVGRDWFIDTKAIREKAYD